MPPPSLFEPISVTGVPGQLLIFSGACTIAMGFTHCSTAGVSRSSQGKLLETDIDIASAHMLLTPVHLPGYAQALGQITFACCADQNLPGNNELCVLLHEENQGILHVK